MIMSIVTKYLPATNHRCSRVTARRNGKSVTKPWDHELETFENHAEVAKALAQKMGWHCEKIYCVPLEQGYVFTTPGGLFTVDITAE
jgi:hypothetical protein